MRIFFITVSTISLLGSAAMAAEPLKPRAEVNWRYGQERAILMSELWVPFAQSETSVFYGDYRMMGDNQDNREFNAGLGYRSIIDTKLFGKSVLGVHGWYDRRLTEQNSKFNQITGGFELKSGDYDLLLNAYVPLNEQKSHTRANPNGTNPKLVGNQIIVNTDQLIVEEALVGADLELGIKLDFLDDFTDSTRLYGAVYHFDSDRAEDITGWRTRLASDITPNIQLGARFQKDSVRGSQGFLEATIRFPFGQKKSYKQEGIRARLDESPERDIDIVSNEAVLDDGLNKPLLNATTGTTQNIIYVNNTSGGGDGSAENPYNTLAAANAAAGENDIIYVHRGDGTTAGQNAGITLNNDGQMLLGAGTDITFDTINFKTPNGLGLSGSTTLISADPLGAPKITNGAGNGIDITADKILVKGIGVESASNNGIYARNNSGQAWSSLTIEAVTISGNNDAGLEIVANGAGSAINNTSIKATTSSLNDGSGISFTATNNGVFDNTTLENVTINGNTGTGGNGLELGASSSSKISNFVVRNVDIYSNESRGMYMRSSTASEITNVLFDTVTSNSNSNNFNSNDRGFQIWASGSTGAKISDLTFRNVTASNNDSRGIFFYADGDGIINSSIENSTFTNNGGFGVHIDNAGTGLFQIDLGGGTFDSVGRNSIHSNTATNIRIDINGNELKAENNYWGTPTGLAGGDVTLLDASTIDADPFLSEEP